MHFLSNMTLSTSFLSKTVFLLHYMIHKVLSTLRQTDGGGGGGTWEGALLRQTWREEGAGHHHYQVFPLVCFSSSSCFSTSENCRSSSKELLSRSWMYCSMLLLDLCGGMDSGVEREWVELDGATCMLLNWLRRSSYWGEN